MSKVETGLYDSNRSPIHVGDLIKIEVSCNRELHGEYSIYEVQQRGIVPVLSYQRSENGQVLPKGMSGAPLSDMYDTKLLCSLEPGHILTPSEHMIVMDASSSVAGGNETKRENEVVRENE